MGLPAGQGLSPTAGTEELSWGTTVTQLEAARDPPELATGRVSVNSALLGKVPAMACWSWEGLLTRP